VATSPKPAALPGFGHIQRHWDPQVDRWCAKILPGEYFVTTEDEGITTVLGSCISACFRDPALGIGGMNHFMLPEDNSGGTSSWIAGTDGLSTRYGSYAMERLINDLMKLGASRSRFEVKLFGGGKILSTMTDVGARNIEFARRFLKLEAFKVISEDVGDVFPRRVMYFPDTGRVLIKRLRSLDCHTIASRETQYLGTLSKAPTTGEVELF
jgi:chemotaxis protein CheD